MVGQLQSADRAARKFLRLSRSELFAGLFVLACPNGLIEPVSWSVNQVGWPAAVLKTFGISAIVWVACCAGISLIFRNKIDDNGSTDVAIGAVVLSLVVLPISQLSWLAVTTLSLYILVFTTASQPARRGAIILLAASVPMLWSKLLFGLFRNFFLEMDASLVSWELGTRRSGNEVEFADHSATLVIFAPCSSLANMSLAFLCWVTLSQLVQHKWRFQDLLWCLAACASVVAVNVTRMSLMALSSAHYRTIHGEAGDMITSWIILILTVGISLLGLKREIRA